MAIGSADWQRGHHIDSLPKQPKLSANLSAPTFFHQASHPDAMPADWQRRKKRMERIARRARLKLSHS
jgi:hypothetical protein